MLKLKRSQFPGQNNLSSKNFILSVLPEDARTRLLPSFERVELKRGHILNRAEEVIEYIHFPNNAVISLITSLKDGEVAEAGIVGSEGIVGIDVFLGKSSMYNEAVVQTPGSAVRIKTADILKEFKRGEVFHDAALEFFRLLLIQISQTAFCNRLHLIEQRLAKWLLFCSDRCDSDQLPLTQEFLSIMLGSNRTSVTRTAMELQNAGIIKYSRGRIKIIDRQKLEECACVCYQLVKAQYDSLLIPKIIGAPKTFSK